MCAAVQDEEAQLAKLDAEFKRVALDSLNEAEAAVSLRGGLKKAKGACVIWLSRVAGLMTGG